VTKKRRVSYQWRLREVMASRGIFTIGDLVVPLAEGGIKLSVSQVHRLVTGTPERLSLPVLAALCDILEVTPSELIATRAENVEVRRTGTGPDLGVVDMAAPRPKRARILPEE
jgi:DNA-binding Xre family transcriptional regulator